MKYGQKGFSALSTLTKIALTILSLVSGTLTVSEDVFNSDVKGERDTRGRLATVIQGAGIGGGGSSTIPKTTPTYTNTYIKNRNTGTQYTPTPTTTSTPKTTPAVNTYIDNRNTGTQYRPQPASSSVSKTPSTPSTTPTINRYLENRNTGIQTTPTPTTTTNHEPIPAVDTYKDNRNTGIKICTEGAYSCDGDSRKVCNSGGSGWSSAGTCACGCGGGSCNVCTEEQTQALKNTMADFREADKKNIESYEDYINKRKEEEVPTTPSSKPLIIDNPRPVCNARSYRCSGNKREMCNSGGSGWSSAGTCACGCGGGSCNKCTEEEVKELKNTIDDFREAEKKSIKSYEELIEEQKKAKQERIERRLEDLLEFKKIDNEKYKEYQKKIGGTGSCKVGETTCSTIGSVSILYKCSADKRLIAQSTCGKGCSGNSCGSTICNPYETKCTNRDTPARCSSDGMSWIKGPTCLGGCNMETGSCYADSGTVETQKIPTCFKGDGCGEGWYCNGDVVPRTSGSFVSQYCTKEETEEKKTLWETIEEKAEAAFGSGEYLSFGDGTNAVPAYCYLDTDEGRDCRNAMEKVGTVILGTAGGIIGGAVGGPQGAVGLGLFGSTIIPLTKDIGCEISGNCSEQEKLAIQEQLFYALAGAQTFVEVQMGVNAQTNINNFWQSQIDSIVPDGDDLFRANTTGASNISANIYPEFEYAEDTNKLAKYITGLDLDDPNMRDLLVEDVDLIRNKYSLPPKDMLSDAPGEYLSSLQEIANKEGIEILPDYEVGSFFNDNPSAQGVHLDSGDVGGKNIVSVRTETWSKELGEKVPYYKSRDAFVKRVTDVEHEIVHAIQKNKYLSMPNEIMEYEAYMSTKNTTFIQNATPSDLNNYIFGPFSIKGSVDFHYDELNEVALYMLNK